MRTVAIPPHVLRDIAEHLDRFTGSGPDAWLFPDADGGPLRPHRLTWPWRRARAAIGRPDLHLHDLRHTSNTWAAATGASTKELMRRYGHASPAAALRYQHATEDRDQVIADAMTELILPAPVIPISAGNGTAMARRRHGERKTL